VTESVIVAPDKEISGRETFARSIYAGAKSETHSQARKPVEVRNGN